MNAKILILIILIGLGAIGVMVFEPTQEEKVKNEPETAASTSTETVLVKDGFQITLPAGWQEIENFQDTLLMAVDAQEESTGDFKTNVSIKNDDLSVYDSVPSVQEYIDNVKISLIQIIPGIQFTSENQGKIDGRSAFFIECESTQEGVDFKTLLVFIEGDNNIIWAISFNTFQNSWATYQNLFYEIAQNFQFN